MKRATTSKPRAAVDELENLFKALADKTRLRILALLGNNEVCVCHIHDSLGLPQPTVSRHLAYLRKSGLVAARRDGVWMHYQVSRSLESGDSRRRRGRGGRVATAASHDSGPEAVSTFVRTAVRARQPRWWRVLCASCAGVAAMIESATERDLPEIRALLERLHLPLAGVDEHLPTMLVARDGEQIVGTAALELYADGALLRSVAVEPRRQGRQLGHQLTDAALQPGHNPRREHRLPVDDDSRAVFSQVRLRADRPRAGAAVRSRVGGVSIRVSDFGDRHAEAAASDNRSAR